MTLRPELRTLAMLLSLPLLACEPDAPPADPVADAADAMGGEGALLAVDSLRVAADGRAFEPGQSFAPGEGAEASTYRYTLTEDLARGASRQEWSVTASLLFAGTALAFTEVSDGEAGFVDGVNSVFGGPPQSPMLASHITSRARQRRLADPLALMRAALADRDAVRLLGERDFDGRPHQVFEVDDSLEPVRIFVDPETGLPAKSETLEGDPVLGDSLYEVIYADYRAAGDIRLPFRVTHRLGGFTLRDEARSAIDVDVAIDPADFAIPAALVVPPDPALARFGEEIAAWFQRLQSLLLPLYFDQGGFVQATELAPGVLHLTGGSHHTLAIELSDRVIVVEAPLYDERSRALLAELGARFPGKPIGEVVMTHHHTDHAGGVRGFAAAGAAVIVPAADAAFAREMLDAPHAVYSDSLAENPREVAIRAVDANGRLSLTDGQRIVEIVDLPSSHAAGIVGAFLPAEGILFVSDLFSPGTIPPGVVLPPGPARDQLVELLGALEALGIDGQITAIAGGHGTGTSTVADVRFAAGL